MPVKYKQGSGFIVGYPARDLSDEDIQKLGTTEEALVKTGLYEKVQKRVVEDKLERRKKEDKSSEAGE